MLDLFLSLKTQYGKYRKMMTETGQGLIDDGREDEITPGSEIANMWGRYSMFTYLFRRLISVADLIQTRFPWYKRMHALMGTSPIFDRSAIAHSRTTVDLYGLTRDRASVRSFFLS